MVLPVNFRRAWDEYVSNLNDGPAVAETVQILADAIRFCRDRGYDFDEILYDAKVHAMQHRAPNQP